eukprot:CAMPEP_0114170766 /NCGR_PEP_ID=MMETSP0043_2-20121206/34329_1 /TAXON_ID=464988 /ORGANISM="Hemiselmis andersenii, Strain CCMP644" /LENGTH=550 /DNA_ID=CAMNT_0001268421 /DNA_START=64 /DNA_END=1715 /DNA_ORIENTATION=-
MAAYLPLDLLSNVLVQGRVSLGGLCQLSCVSKHWHKATSLAMGHSSFRSLSLCVDVGEHSSPLRRLVGLEELDLCGRDASEFLSKLSVEGVGGHVDEAGILMCGRLRTLGLGRARLETVKLFCFLCRSLESVDLSKTEVGDDGVMMMSLMLNLRELSLRECRISDVALDSMAQSSRNLEVLDLSKCKGSLTDGGVRSICGGCGKLRTLVLSWCGQVTLGCIGDMSRLSKLESLIAAGLPCSSFPALECFSSLTQLDMSVTRPFWQISDAVVSSLPTSLQTLRLVGCGISDVGVVSLAARMPALTSLDLTGTRVSDRGVSAISMGCPHLLVLRLNSCSSVGDSGFACVASRLTSLRELDIKKSCLVSNKGLAELSISRHRDGLHVLSVAHCGGVSAEGLLRAIRKNSGCGEVLRVLNVAGLVVTKALLEAFSALPLLRWLNVTDCILHDSSEESHNTPNMRSEHVPSYEYATVILQLPALRMEGKHVLKPRSLPMHSTASFAHKSGFQSLETLHTDRCKGVSCLLRFVVAVGAPALRRITLSGPEALGADI